MKFNSKIWDENINDCIGVHLNLHENIALFGESLK